MMLNNRQMLCSLVAVSALLTSPIALATGETSGPVSSDRIIRSLSRDIVLDQPAQGGGVAVAQPSVDLYVQFAFNSAELTPLGRRQLDELGKALNSRSLLTWGFELAGHTDAVGAADYNMRLSLERANAVKHYLVTMHSLNPGRLLPVGFGFTRLADPANPRSVINRRVEVKRVAMVNGQAVSSGAQGAVGFQAPAPAPTTLGGRLVPTP
jgi:outer membrane protein OmpA-like peptidoglycan-associated protein